jgi:hypothetical protein
VKLVYCKTWVIAAIPAAILWLGGCDIDHGLGTLDSMITGEILFLNPEQQPEKVESVRVVAAVRVPPEIARRCGVHQSSVNLSRDRSYYEIPAPLAEYQLVAQSGKKKARSWDYSNILSFTDLIQSISQSKNRPITLSKASLLLNISIFWLTGGWSATTSTRVRQTNRLTTNQC